MKLAPIPHPLNITPKEAICIQRRLAGAVRHVKPKKKIRTVAGVDVAFSRDDKKCFAAVVVWDITLKTIIETQTASKEINFPYVPGLLTFREAPAVLAALKKLKHTPDAIMYDGHGIAHPRRFGIAAHLGVLVGLPTIGCAKSRLVGEYRQPGPRRGSRTLLKDKGETIGVVLRTRDNVKPVFVSVGHKIDLETAVDTVLACSIGYRLPEPTRLADQWTKKQMPGASQTQRLPKPPASGSSP